MRFFEQWGGFIWEYNSLGEYFQVLLGRLTGTILGIAVLFFLCCLFYYYLEGHWPNLAPIWDLLKSLFVS